MTEYVLCNNFAVLKHFIFQPKKNHTNTIIYKKNVKVKSNQKLTREPAYLVCRT